MFVVICLECRLRDNCPAGVDEPANSADHYQTAHRTAPLHSLHMSVCPKNKDHNNSVCHLPYNCNTNVHVFDRCAYF